MQDGGFRLEILVDSDFDDILGIYITVTVLYSKITLQQFSLVVSCESDTKQSVDSTIRNMLSPMCIPIPVHHSQHPPRKQNPSIVTSRELPHS